MLLPFFIRFNTSDLAGCDQKKCTNLDNTSGKNNILITEQTKIIQKFCKPIMEYINNTSVIIDKDSGDSVIVKS